MAIQAARGMTKYWLNVALLRVVLPVILAGCESYSHYFFSVLFSLLISYNQLIMHIYDFKIVETDEDKYKIFLHVRFTLSYAFIFI